MKINKKGSAIVMVIMASSVCLAYASTATAEVISGLYTQKNIEKQIKDIYEKDIENIDFIYNKLEGKLN